MNTPINRPSFDKPGAREFAKQRDAKERAEKIAWLKQNAPWLVLATGIAAAAVGVVGKGIVDGYNDTPRAGEREVFLTNETADHEYECLRELFSDTCEGTGFRNKWMAENCDPELLDPIRDEDGRDAVLKATVKARKKVLKSVGISGKAVKWKCGNGGMFQEYENPETVYKGQTHLDEAIREEKIVRDQQEIQERQRVRRMPLANPPYRKGKRQTP